MSKPKKAMKPKKSKGHRSLKCEYQGIAFDSVLEKDFYIELQRRQGLGEFVEITLQPKLTLQPKFKRDGKTVLPITYTPDFLTVDKNGTKVYWDAKGVSTQQGDLRRKMYLYVYPEELRWVTKSTKYAVDGDPWVDYDYLQKCRREAKKKSKEVC